MIFIEKGKVREFFENANGALRGFSRGAENFTETKNEKEVNSCSFFS